MVLTERRSWRVRLLYFVISVALAVNNIVQADETRQYVIKGKVVEKGSRRPLAGANVYVMGRDDLFTTTDNDGIFELQVTDGGSYEISAVAVDFRKPRPTKVVISDAQQTPSKLTLYLMPTALAPVVIQAERNEDRVGKTVISGQELEEVPGSGGDPLKAVQSLPGVTTGNDASSAPAVRGSRPGDNAYYLDDIEVGYLYHLGGLISVVPADLVSDFNLFASAFGPQYGDVIGAVFDVGLRNPRTDRFGAKIDVSLLASELLVEGPISKNQSFFLSARRSYLDLLIKNINNQDRGVSVVVPNYYDYLGKYVWDIDSNNRLKLYLNGAGDEISIEIAEDSDIARNEPVFAGESFSNTNYHNQSLVWDSKAGTSNNSLIVGHRTTAADSKTGTAFKLSSDWNTWFLRDAFRYRAIKRHDITLGGGYDKYAIGINADGVNSHCTAFNPDQCNDYTDAQRASLHDTVHVNFWNAFVKDRWRLADKVTWITGARYTAEDYLNTEYVEPRLGLEWELTPKTLFTMGWGKYHQFPSGRYVLENFGNPHLSQIQSDHWVMGVEAKLDKFWFVKSDLYYKSFDNFIVADDTQNFVNGASGKAYGIEFLLKRNPVDALSGWLSVTLSKSERHVDATGQTFPFSYDQPVIVTLVSTYKFSPKFHMGVKWNYHSGSRYTPITGGDQIAGKGTPEISDDRYTPILGANNSARFPDYHRLDLRFDYDWYFNTWKLQTYFEMINVYNQCNVAGYDYDRQYNVESKKKVCQLPMIPSFGVQAEF